MCALIDAATSGSIMGKSPEEVYDLFEEMTNNYQWPLEQSTMGIGVHAIDAVMTLIVTREVSSLKVQGAGANTFHDDQ